MEITGKIIVVEPAVGGVSQRTGNPWKRQNFVIETDERYPRKCAFSVFGEDKLKEMNIKEGDVLKVYIDIDAREYKGSWYNDIQAWKVERMQTAAPVQAATQTASSAPSRAKDDLPF